MFNSDVPVSLRLGEVSKQGIKLLEVSTGEKTAVIEYQGEVLTLHLGRTPLRSQAPDGPTLTLLADARGHHVTPGSVNGRPLRFLIDSGASLVTLGRGDADRAGINYRRGVPAQALTASGVAEVWQVRLDTLKVGEILMTNVEAIVLDNDLPFALLGQSFLRRTEIEYQGSRLILRPRR